MQITYTLTQRDFVDSLFAIQNRKKWVKWAYRAIVVVLLVLVAGGLLGSLTRHGSWLSSDTLTPLAMLLVWILMMRVSPWWTARIQFQKQPSAKGEQTVILDSNGVEWRWQGGFSKVEWNTYIQWMETKNTVLLFSSPLKCGILPKHAIDPNQLLDLRRLLNEKIDAGRQA